jgi:outer membrane protein assembly factor BamB
MPRKRWLVLCVSLAALAAQIPAGANDWPGWRGADRSGVSPETGLLKEWSGGGPKLAWEVKGMGGGFSTPSVAAGHVFLTGNKGMDDEFVQALSVKDGSQVWSTHLGKVGNPNQQPPHAGSRSTPTVDGELVYALGSDGDLAGLEAATGKERWHKNLRTDFGGEPGAWAYAESPLVDGDLVICTPGGPQVALVALNKKTGEVVWKTEVPGANKAAYSSAIVAEAGGVKQYVQFLGSGLVGVAAKDGKLLWRYDKLFTNTICPTPVFHDGCIFETVGGMARGGRGATGCALLRLSPDGTGVQEAYRNAVLPNHHGGVVRVGEYLYGTTNTDLVCLDFKTGAVKWKERSVGKGSVAAADGRLYVRGEETGDVALVEASPAGYKELGRLTQPDRSKKKAWPHPVIADGRLYLRDENVLLCYDVKGP